MYLNVYVRDIVLYAAVRRSIFNPIRTQGIVEVLALDNLITSSDVFLEMTFHDGF